jgi:hypothetical protein
MKKSILSLLILCVIQIPAMAWDSAGWIQDQTVGNLKVLGNIGIGTTIPRGKVEVDGMVYLSDTSSSHVVNGYVGFDGSTNAIDIATFTAHPVRIETNNVVRLTVDANGNVGVGTTLPITALQVGTGTRTAGATATATDSVFKNSVQIDGTVYNPGITVTSGNYVCYKHNKSVLR